MVAPPGLDTLNAIADGPPVTGVFSRCRFRGPSTVGVHGPWTDTSFCVPSRFATPVPFCLSSMINVPLTAQLSVQRVGEPTVGTNVLEMTRVPLNDPR